MVPHEPAAHGEHAGAPAVAENEPAGQATHAVPLRALPALHTAVPESVTPPAPSVHDVLAAVFPSAKQSSAAPLTAAGEGGVKEKVASVELVRVTVVVAAAHPYIGVATKNGAAPRPTFALAVPSESRTLALNVAK